MKWLGEFLCAKLLLLATRSMLSLAFTAAPPSLVFYSKVTAHQNRLYAEQSAVKDRPLLRQFGKAINERIILSTEGHHRLGLADHYTSEETIPCLNMQCGSSESNANISSRRAIRKAYTAKNEVGGMHGRSSGSGCSIIRLRGEDAKSVRGLVDFADRFFEGVDNDERNADIKDVGIIRVANNVHAGFDVNVNQQGKMQVLYTKVIPGENGTDDPSMLPLEVGELVGTQSMSQAHKGMNTLLDIGSQVTSAVLGMDSSPTTKLIDDCTRSSGQPSESMLAKTVSNSYQRLIRYLEPQQVGATDATDTAFWPHVDSTFLTLIPMTTPGLEVWCPSSENAMHDNLAKRGEWVRPIKPISGDDSSIRKGSSDEEDDCVYVFALAGEFLELLSDGSVNTCIHRVIPPGSPPSPEEFAKEKYVPRISAPLFVRPRRGEDATLNVVSDLNKSADEDKGMYFEEGLLDECDGMVVWNYMDCMSPNN